jgi:hypothetical protein
MSRLRKVIMQAAATFAVVGLSSGGLHAQGAAPSTAPAQHPRNIIFVLVDDLRFDGMGFLQAPGLLHTPNIDRMAREGTISPMASPHHPCAAPAAPRS